MISYTRSYNELNIASSKLNSNRTRLHREQGEINLVLINIYGKIQPIIISKKLGIGISNPSSDWVDGFLGDFEKEILIHNHDIASFEKSGFDISWANNRYDLENLVMQLGWQEDKKSTMQIIAEHLIEIQVSDFENSLLQIKNEHLDNPTCEPQYTRKFLKFCSVLQSSRNAEKIIPRQVPPSTYNSDDLHVQPLILNYLLAMLHTHPHFKVTIDDYTEGGIASLKYIGKLIDEFLITDEDFWLLDYIINAIYFDNDYNAYHIFKVMSIIELLIINPKRNGKTEGETEQKLPFFLSEYIPASKGVLFAELMRKFRNKIGHGDFRAVQKLLEQYRQEFMENFWFDEIEYSIESWTYGDICIRLNEALGEILWLMLSDKAKLQELRLS